MHGYSRVIGYHPVILRRVSAPESAYLGLHIYRTRNIRPSARQPLKRPLRVEKNRPTPKRGFPVQANFFAVVSNPNTQGESTGIIRLTFWAPVHGYSRVIGYRPVILRPVSAPESAFLGRHTYRTPNIRPSARRPPKAENLVRIGPFVLIGAPNLVSSEQLGTIQSLWDT